MKKFLFVTLAVLGLAVASGQAKPTVQLVAGATTVTFAKSFLDAAGTLGLGINRVSPAWLGSNRGDTIAWFPIALGGASLDLGTAKGEILHTGGLRLSAGGKVVTLTNYAIDTTGTSPVLTGLVSVDGSVVTRAPLFDLTLPAGLTVPIAVPKNRVLKIPSVQVKLTGAAASLLNSVFGTALPGGLEIGTANVTSLVH